MSKSIKSEIIQFTQDNGDIFNIVFQALEVICLGFLVIGVCRKDGRLTLPALVLYPIKSIYAILSSFYYLFYVLSESNFEGSYTTIIASTILWIVTMVLIWITVSLYRKQLKEQKSDSSRMVVC